VCVCVCACFPCLTDTKKFKDPRNDNMKTVNLFAARCSTKLEIAIACKQSMFIPWKKRVY
jgi:hypothetical protein